MIWPGSIARPYGAMRLATHAIPLAGWPSTPAARPVSSTTPLHEKIAPIHGMSTSAGATLLPPRITPASAALSAIVSTIVRGRLVTGMDAIAARIDELECRLDVLSRLEHIVDGDRFAAEPLTDDERDFDFELGVDVVRVTKLHATAHDHVVEQRTEIGLVDLHLLLHRSRRQADLATHHLRPVGDLQIDPRLLHRVGIGDVEVGVVDGDRIDGLDLRACPLVSLGQFQRQLVGDHRVTP